jgi:hypothetical protein
MIIESPPEVLPVTQEIPHGASQTRQKASKRGMTEVVPAAWLAFTTTAVVRVGGTDRPGMKMKIRSRTPPGAGN